MSTRRVTLVVSVDTEEDNWARARTGLTVENIRELPRLQAFLRGFGVRPTYFATYAVSTVPWAAQLIGSVVSEGAELGAHLHPWNTPPTTEDFTPSLSMLGNLPPELQLHKIERLTETLASRVGATPHTFRAGRYGLGEATAPLLLRCGYRVDSSVTPLVDWRLPDGGPNYMGAPLGAYRLGREGDVTKPDPSGALIELPVSCGFDRGPFPVWAVVFRLMESRPGRAVHATGLASAAGLVRRLRLAPELHSGPELLTVSRRLVAHGVRFLHAHWHSPSLRPGLTPFVATASDVERLYSTIGSFIDGLGRVADVDFATVGEAAARFAPRAEPRPDDGGHGRRVSGAS